MAQAPYSPEGAFCSPFPEPSSAGQARDGMTTE